MRSLLAGVKGALDRCAQGAQNPAMADKLSRRSMTFRPSDRRRIAGLRKMYEKEKGVKLTDQEVVWCAIEETARTRGVDAPDSDRAAGGSS